MKIQIEGTYQELNALWDITKVCELIRVDPYKLCMVSSDEKFKLTETDFVRVGLLPTPTEENTA